MMQPETKQSDGPPTQPDSQIPAETVPEIQLPAVIPPEDKAVTTAKFSDDQKGAIKALRFNGITKARATRILAAAGGSKFLKQEIMGSVVLNFELPSVMIAEKMLKYCAKLIRDKTTPVDEKRKLLQIFPGLQRELSNTCHDSIVAAEKFNPDWKPSPLQHPPVQIGINVNNNSGFPPLAPMPERAKRGALEATNPQGDRDRPL